MVPGPDSKKAERRLNSPVRLCHVLEATTGGTRRHVVDLATHLDPERFEVSVLCSMRRDPGFRNDVERMRSHGVVVEEVDMRRAISPVDDGRACGELRNRFSNGRFDIVHTHSSKAGALGRIAAARAGIRSVIHTPHVFPFQMELSPFTRTVYRGIERRLADRSHAIICVSRSELEAARELGACPESKLHHIPNGIDPDGLPDRTEALRDELGIAPGRKLVGMIGRIARQKGPDLLVAAAQAVHAVQPEVDFLVVGEGPGAPALRRQVDAAGLASAFHLVGAREDASSFYALIDVLALPSRWEGLPYTLLEGMAAGRPVVATSVGGNVDAVTDNQSGLLVPPDSANRLADAICRILTDDDLAARLGSEARDVVRRDYTLERMIGQTTALYEELITRPN